VSCRAQTSPPTGRRQGILRLLAALAAAGALAACRHDAKTPHEGLQSAVIVLLDTLRADHLGCYGYARPTSPEIDAVAAQGVVFEQAISCAPWTRPSIGAILSGLYPRGTSGEKEIASSLVERFRDAGFATAAFTEGGWFTREAGLDLGFDEFLEATGTIDAELGPDGPDPARGAAQTFARAQGWRERPREERFLLVIHTYEVHAPYTHREFVEGMDPQRIGPWFGVDLLASLRSGQLVLSPGEREYVKALYDGDVRSADRQVGGLLASLDRLDLSETTLVVLTSDHGEELGEHHPDYVGDHGHSLRDHLLRVPLIVRDPTRAAIPLRVAAQVRTIDVLPTVADLLGVVVPGALDGASLRGLIEGTESAERPALSGWVRKGPRRASLRSGGHKLIRILGPGSPRRGMLHPPPDRQLFDLARDPGEAQDLSAYAPGVLESMQATLDRMLGELDLGAAEADGGELDERLRSLGYVR